jgi:hypothetical protein
MADPLRGKNNFDVVMLVFFNIPTLQPARTQVNEEKNVIKIKRNINKQKKINKVTTTNKKYNIHDPFKTGGEPFSPPLHNIDDDDLPDNWNK